MDFALLLCRSITFYKAYMQSVTGVLAHFHYSNGTGVVLLGRAFTKFSPSGNVKMNGILYLTVLRISSELSAITHMLFPREGGRLNKEIKMATQWKYTEASRIEITEGQIFGIQRLNWKNRRESSNFSRAIRRPKSGGSESLSTQF